jgi:hypothetical protein
MLITIPSDGEAPVPTALLTVKKSYQKNVSSVIAAEETFLLRSAVFDLMRFYTGCILIPDA